MRHHPPHLLPFAWHLATPPKAGYIPGPASAGTAILHGVLGGCPQMLTIRHGIVRLIGVGIEQTDRDYLEPRVLSGKPESDRALRSDRNGRRDGDGAGER
jgi:hypothetical protein